MVEALRREVTDPRVLDAMADVPRERFVPPNFRAQAYEDRALPIGHGQTISQPLIVAMMTEALHLQPGHRVLEIGSGSGYQAAVLAKLAREVHSVERIEPLRDRAREALSALQIESAVLHPAGDALGDPAHAPFDAILVAAGAPHVPRALIDQLADGGVLVIPIGDLNAQQLVRAMKTPHGLELTRLGPCGFVPLLGREAWPERSRVAVDDAGESH